MFKNMKIGTRLGLSFGLLTLLLLSMGLFGMNRMGLLAELTSRLYEHPLMVSNAVIQANLNVVKIQNAMKDVLIVEDLARIDGIEEQIADCEGKVEKNFALIQERFLGDPETYRVPMQSFAAWKPIRKRIIALARAGERQKAYVLAMEEEAPHVALAARQMQALTDFAHNKAVQFMDNAAATERETSQVTVALLITAIVLGALVAFFTSRSITRPLIEMAGAADRIACGDIEQQVHYRSKDEIGQLASAFQNLIEYIRNIAAVANRFSQGDLTAEIRVSTPRSRSSSAWPVVFATVNTSRTPSTSIVVVWISTPDVLDPYH